MGGWRGGTAKSKARARGARTGSSFSDAGACGRVPESDGSTPVTPWCGAKTRKLRGKGTAIGMALRAVYSQPLRAGLISAAPTALVGCWDLARALDCGPAVYQGAGTSACCGRVKTCESKPRTLACGLRPQTRESAAP